MAETALELRAILEAAERAVSVDDFVSAEQHLRQAAALQERQIGAEHPDLANTLNNLGIVCEHVGKPAEAEECYRRAYGIASSALPADHPLVQTSGQNLRDFCAGDRQAGRVVRSCAAGARTICLGVGGAEARACPRCRTSRSGNSRSSTTAAARASCARSRVTLTGITTAAACDRNTRSGAAATEAN